MFLHLGSDIVVALDDIISINDYKSFRSVVNREFIKKTKTKNTIVDISENDPKSFVVTKSKVYLSAISSLTLKKRADNLFYNED
ncbi:extracellular matrix regulator RemB [Anaerosinus massiliensis]|uniref:extracellular matrix regulator RemB n=1 Tax=Massilibacillus massiliensis TaxID=1806837 RepID=UPI000DA63CE9|nr:extracellular matrix/biofilm biosynthesis regulator RemA family protein [Massilibacillus massiliensis]